MKRSTLLHIAGLALGLVAMLASPAFAHDHVTTTSGDSTHGEHSHQDRDNDAVFDQMIHGIDTVPSRAAMEQQIPDVQQRLLDLAGDTDATLYERWRATSMLGNFDEPEVQQALLALTDDREDRIRAMSFYVLGHVFLDEGDDELFSQLKEGLDDDSERVRADIVRSFGWTDNSDAHRLLERIATDQKDKSLAGVAERSIERLAE